MGILKADLVWKKLYLEIRQQKKRWIFQRLLGIWCRWWDSNPHAPEDNRFWVYLVCQFRHTGVNCLPIHYTTIYAQCKLYFVFISLYFLELHIFIDKIPIKIPKIAPARMSVGKWTYKYNLENAIKTAKISVNIFKALFLFSRVTIVAKVKA